MNEQSAKCLAKTIKSYIDKNLTNLTNKNDIYIRITYILLSFFAVFLMLLYK